MKATYKNSALVTVLILVALFMPTSGEAPLLTFPHQDKVMHMLLFLLLGVTVWREGKPFSTGKRMLGVALIWGVVLGGLSELGQEYLTNYRTGDWLDFAADIVGTLMGIGIGALITRKKTE